MTAAEPLQPLRPQGHTWAALSLLEGARTFISSPTASFDPHGSPRPRALGWLLCSRADGSLLGGRGRSSSLGAAPRRMARACARVSRGSPRLKPGAGLQEVGQALLYRLLSPVRCFSGLFPEHWPRGGCCSRHGGAAGTRGGLPAPPHGPGAPGHDSALLGSLARRGEGTRLPCGPAVLIC